MNPVVERWNEDLGESPFLEIAANEVKAATRCERVSGWYADYDEGRFMCWRSGARSFVSWKSERVELLPESRVTWESKMSGRSFRLVLGDETQLHFHYYTLARRPWRLLTDILFQDDDWGRAFDLPSFVHSAHSDKSFAELLDRWNERDYA